MKTLAMLVMVAGLTLGLGCSQENSDSPATTTETMAQSKVTEATPAGDDVAISDSELPVAADFEEEADREVTADNYAGILDELEQEIASE